LVKVNIVRDKRGNVVASYEDPEPGRMRIEPVLPKGKGHTVDKVEEEVGYHTDLKRFYQKHKKK
jgi:hypothetical protein